MERQYDVLVVGAGPAGLMAAGQAARRGCQTLLLEKMSRPAIKLLLTGKGRCNLTNTANVPDALLEFNRSGRFLTQLFYRFYNTELRQFFKQLGVATVEQRGGRVFPASENSHDIADALLNWNQQVGVTILVNCQVLEIIIEDQQVKGLKTNQGDFLSNTVILSTGGKAYPGTGSTGDGYALARLAGHTILTPTPALVPLITAGKTARSLQGLSLRNISAAVFIDGEMKQESFGELLFTHFGLSGPVILTMSEQMVRALGENKKVEVAIDLKPALSQETLDARLLRDILELGRKQYSTLLEALLPNKLVPVCCKQTQIPWDKKVSQITSDERKRLLNWLKGGFSFSISGHKGFDQAIITAGGVDTREIDPSSMESKLVKGLYFAGEIIDVHANTGGFNLQAAFSTGWAAGIVAGKVSN